MKIKLNMRKTLDGNILIKNHPKVNIVISPKKSKIILFSKEEIDDDVYAAQKRFIKHMVTKGAMQLGSEQGGNIYGSIEVTIPQIDELDPIQAVLQTVDQYVCSEIEIFDRLESYKKEVENMYLDPDDENSTELGEIPHDDRKGTIPGSPYDQRRIYHGWNY